MSAQVGIIMGSHSDWATMKHAADVLSELGVAHETRIVSAHRTPDLRHPHRDVPQARRHAGGARGPLLAPHAPVVEGQVER